MKWAEALAQLGHLTIENGVKLAPPNQSASSTGFLRCAASIPPLANFQRT